MGNFKIELPVEFKCTGKFLTFVNAEKEEDAREIAMRRLHGKKFRVSDIIDLNVNTETLKVLPVSETDAVFCYKEKKYSKNDVMKVGKDCASIYGGSCFDYELNLNTKEIIFDCVEHNEEFSMSMTFDEFVNCFNDLA